MPQPAAPRTRDERDAVLTRSRTLKMAQSTHAYVRGNTAKFYEWLDASPAARDVPAGPAVWICGDCHIGNLGPLAGADGAIDIQIRDLDQTVIGNPAHDLIRLGLSLASAARSADLPGVTTARILEELIAGYRTALADPDDTDAVPEPRDVRTVRRRALGRRWRHLAAERLAEVRPTIPLGKRFWPLLDDERAALEALFADDAVRDLILQLHHRDDRADVRLVDAAYWKKGCSSLGTLRFAALVAIAAPGRADQVALVDLKQAVPSVAPAAPGAAMPGDPAARVVTGARALSPNLGERMTATTVLGRPVVMRELLPQDLKLEIDQFSRDEAPRAARYLAHVVGLAHARQLGREAGAAWRSEVGRHTGTLDAPSWLWASVVELAAAHEAGYLEHCRRYALEA